MNTTDFQQQIKDELLKEAQLDSEEEASTEAVDAKTEDGSSEEEKEETVYHEELDLGNGKILTFEGSTPEEVHEKLKAAYTAAIQKNEQQSRRLREASTTKVEEKRQPKTLTADEEFALGQQFTSKPSEAIKKAIEAIYGVTVEEFQDLKSEMLTQKAARQAQSAVAEFNAAHPEFVGTPANQTAVAKYLQTYSKPITIDNLEEAYDHLSNTGLLETKRPEQKQESKGKETETVVTKKKFGTSSFGKSGTGIVTVAQDGTFRMPSQAQLDKMSPEQVQELIDRYKQA